MALHLTSTGLDFAEFADHAQMTSEVLDDYEEGLWTPGLTFGGGSTGMVMQASSGNYTKIGQFCAAEPVTGLSAKGSSTGSALLTNTPFSSRTDSGDTIRITGFITYVGSFSNVYGHMRFYGGAGGTTVQWIMQSSSSSQYDSTVAMTQAQFSDASHWRGMIFYPTA